MAKATIPSEANSIAPRRSLRQLIQSNQVFVGGIVSEYMRPSLFKLYGYAGFDFGFIEFEHAWFDPTMMSASILAAKDIGLPIITKVSQLNRAEIGKFLEMGVSGIQLPRTESRADVKTLFDYLQFIPKGTRAIAPGYGNTSYRQPANWPTWMNEQNNEIALVVHIETRLGYERAEEIISTPGVDMVYVGPGDFSIAMGHPGDYDHPEVIGPMEKILSICKQHNVAFGTTASGVESAQRWVAKGARFFEAMDELTMISTSATQLIRQYREITAPAQSK